MEADGGRWRWCIELSAESGSFIVRFSGEPVGESIVALIWAARLLDRDEEEEDEVDATAPL